MSLHKNYVWNFKNYLLDACFVENKVNLFNKVAVMLINIESHFVFTQINLKILISIISYHC